jgi:hypothetical protein
MADWYLKRGDTKQSLIFDLYRGSEKVDLSTATEIRFQ